MRVDLQRVDNAFLFQALGASGVPVHIDASAQVGGQEKGARPMELVLMGLASCSAIDFILILKKQRQQLDDISIRVDADRKQATPSPFERIHMNFTLKGKLDPNKVEKALKLSVEKYCSAAEMIKSTARIEYTFDIVDNEITT